MKTDIVLAFPPNNMESVLGKGSNFVTDLEPLSLLYLAAMLERHHYKVKVLDAYADRKSVV